MGIFGKPESKPAEPTAPPAPRVTPPPPVAPAAPTSHQHAAPKPAASTVCVIGAKTTLKGEITGEEDVLVEGVVEGQIRISRELRIGPGGIVRANVEAQSIWISGEVMGDCRATHRVEIQSTGRLNGNISAPRVVI